VRGGSPAVTVRRTPVRPVDAVLGAFLVLPLTFLGGPSIAGFLPSGWAWLLMLGLAGTVVITHPPPLKAVRFLLPYLFFLAYALVTVSWAADLEEAVQTWLQLFVPVLAYLAAWMAHGEEIIPRVAAISRVTIMIAGAVTVLQETLGSLGPVQLSTRPMGISLALLFVVATADSKSFPRTAGYGLGCIAIGMLSGSRTASLVLVVLLMSSPSLVMRWRGRVATALVCAVALVAVAQTDAFRERFFFTDPDAPESVSLDALNTAGRRELWPRLIKACGPTELTGIGVGQSSELSARLLEQAVTHPHNDYLRTWCETGWVGTVPFWAFWVLGAGRSLLGVRSGMDARIHGIAGQVVLALLLFSITDNPIIYTAHFMAPAAVVLGLSDARLRPWGRHRVDVLDEDHPEEADAG
jgi:O-antigen ligase